MKAKDIILGVERRNIADLKPYHGNPKLGDIDAIAESMEANGIFNVLGVDPKTNEVLYGSHRLHGLHQAGADEAWVVLLDVEDENHAKKINLADNRSSDLGKYDPDILAKLLSDLPTLDGTGYDQASLEELLACIAPPPEGLTDTDDVPAPPKEAFTVPGDLWLLGEHRLLCGDATKIEEYDRLIPNGKPVDCVVTDPPYGVGIGAKNRALNLMGKGGHRTEDLSGDQGFAEVEVLWRASFAAIEQTITPGVPFYVFGPQRGELGLLLLQLLREAKIPARHMLIWMKQRKSFSMGRLDYDYAHEPIAYGWKAGAAHPWFATETKSSVLEYPRPAKSRDHATMKPVALIEELITNSTVRGQRVLDPFLGTGTTVLAAEVTGRIGYGLEIDPTYCDVICRRYQEHTGIVPIHEATKEPHGFTA